MKVSPAKCFDGLEPEQNEGATRLMARKLKTYQTSLGFFEQAIAAPSMKAALEAWGADSNLFHQGAAKESHDPDVIAATMAKPGIVLKRPVGSSGPFNQHAELPSDLDGGHAVSKNKKTRSLPKKRPTPKVRDEEARKAAAAFEREQRRRDAERRKEDAARERGRAKRDKMVAKAQAALESANGLTRDRPG